MKVVLKNSTLQFKAVKEPVKVVDGEFTSASYYNFNYSPSDFGITETGIYKIVLNPVTGKDRPKYFEISIYNTNHEQGGSVTANWAVCSNWIGSADEIVGTYTFDVIPAEIAIVAAEAVGTTDTYPIYLDIQVYKLD